MHISQDTHLGLIESVSGTVKRMTVRETGPHESYLFQSPTVSFTQTSQAITFPRILGFQTIQGGKRRQKQQFLA